MEYHHCVDIFVINDKYELLLQKRAANDKSYPGHWDFSAGGHIDQGETDRAAAEREVLEELGISGDIKYVGRELFHYPAWHSSIQREVDAVIFKINHNGPFQPDSGEVETVKFFDFDTIGQMISGGEKFHPEFLLFWEKGIIRKPEK